MRDVIVSWKSWSFWLEQKSGEKERLLVNIRPIEDDNLDDVFLVEVRGEHSGLACQFKMWDDQASIESKTANAVQLILNKDVEVEAL